MEGETINWSESVEDLVRGGDIDQAISLLESFVAKLETSLKLSPQSGGYSELSSALFDLAELYSTKGFSLKADETRSRALILKKQGSLNIPSNRSELENAKRKSNRNLVLHDEASPCCGGESSKLPHDEGSIDDWEAIADHAPDDLLSSHCLLEVSKLSVKDTTEKTPKRRGRGTFSYKKHGLYSDQQSDGPVFNDSEHDTVPHCSEADAETSNLKYGTRHALVLSNFPPSTTTIDLEKLLENFKGRGVVIRWVNDTVALAVFKSPSLALEALAAIQCPFKVRVLDEEDELLDSIQTKDLEPPRRRPETSTRTAQRLIAQGMGMKLPTLSFGSRELRKQEEERKNRILARQNMRDDAWGDDI